MISLKLKEDLFIVITGMGIPFPRIDGITTCRQA
jgi:hypothetical protein